MTNEAPISQEAAAGRLEDALRSRVGRGQRYSFKTLSEKTGISERTLMSYVQGSTPHFAAFLTLCDFFGAGFTSEILGICGQSAREASEDEAEHLHIITALCGLSSQIAEAIEDGHVDHQEAARLRRPAQDLIEVLEPLTQDRRRDNTVPLRGRVG